MIYEHMMTVISVIMKFADDEVSALTKGGRVFDP
jgi:hypothetical protein